LGQFIQAKTAQKFSDRCDSWIFLDFESDPITVDVLVGQIGLHEVGLGHHGPKFEELKRHAILAHPGGSVKNRPAIVKPNGEGNRREQGSKKQKRKPAEQKIKESLGGWGLAVGKQQASLPGGSNPGFSPGWLGRAAPCSPVGPWSMAAYEIAWHE